MTQHKPTKVITSHGFVEGGFLQEVNRRFFHPIGLALGVHPDSDGESGGDGSFQVTVYDYREDPEGVYYGANVMEWDKYVNVQRLFWQRVLERRSRLGYVIQPGPARPEPPMVHHIGDWPDTP
jgi:hypothetical protein